MLLAPSVASLQSFSAFAIKQIAKRDYKTETALKSDWMSHSDLEIVNVYFTPFSTKKGKNIYLAIHLHDTVKYKCKLF